MGWEPAITRPDECGFRGKAVRIPETIYSVTLVVLSIHRLS